MTSSVCNSVLSGVWEQRVWRSLWLGRWGWLDSVWQIESSRQTEERRWGDKRAWCRGYSWLRNWFPCEVPSHQTPSERTHTTTLSMKNKNSDMKLWSLAILPNFLLSQLSLVILSKQSLAFQITQQTKTHLNQLKGKTLMKDAVDPSTSRQLICVYLITWTFNTLLKVHRELLHHPEEKGSRE